MRRLNSYITEKLHLHKGVKRPKDITHFIVVYTGRLENEFSVFDTYEEAKKCVDKRNCLNAWCLTDEDYQNACEAIYRVNDTGPGFSLYKNWFSRLEDCAKEHKFTKIWGYEKLK